LFNFSLSIQYTSEQANKFQIPFLSVNSGQQPFVAKVPCLGEGAERRLLK
jgi:hypothetical protein